MTWADVFGIVNGVALIAWAALLALPWRDRVVPALRWGVSGALCLVYALAVAWALAIGFGETGPPADFTTIEGVRAIFATDGGVTVGWTHYLAFDLFVGLWIAERADERGVARWAQAPILLLTFVAGPAGLLTWLVVEATRRGRA